MVCPDVQQEALKASDESSSAQRNPSVFAAPNSLAVSRLNRMLPLESSVHEMLQFLQAGSVDLSASETYLCVSDCVILFPFLKTKFTLKYMNSHMCISTFYFARWRRQRHTSDTQLADFRPEITGGRQTHP